MAATMCLQPPSLLPSHTWIMPEECCLGLYLYHWEWTRDRSAPFFHPVWFSWKAMLWLHTHEDSLDLTGQLVKIPRNRRRISDNLPMTCKWRVLACCNRSDKMLYNPNGGNKLKLFMVFGENGLGIDMSCFINLSASVVWSFSKFESTGKTILSTPEAISTRRHIPGNIF